MITEVRKEHGEWIVFVDDNPQFSFMYREEADKVRNVIEVLVDTEKTLKAIWNTKNSSLVNKSVKNIQETLKDIGAI